MTTFTQPQIDTVRKAMLEAGCTPEQVDNAVRALPLGHGGTTTVSQVIDTVEAGSVVVGYSARRIG